MANGLSASVVALAVGEPARASESNVALGVVDLRAVRPVLGIEPLGPLVLDRLASFPAERRPGSAARPCRSAASSLDDAVVRDVEGAPVAVDALVRVPFDSLGHRSSLKSLDPSHRYPVVPRPTLTACDGGPRSSSSGAPGAWPPRSGPCARPWSTWSATRSGGRRSAPSRSWARTTRGCCAARRCRTPSTWCCMPFRVRGRCSRSRSPATWTARCGGGCRRSPGDPDGVRAARAGHRALALGSYVARPLLRWNHHRMMLGCIAGLRDRLAFPALGDSTSPT